MTESPSYDIIKDNNCIRANPAKAPLQKLFSPENSSNDGSMLQNSFRYTKPIFVRQEAKYNAQGVSADFKCLTVAFTSFKLSNAVNISGKIQVTKSTFKAKNCTFSFSADSSNAKYPLIEVFANSTAEFENCKFLNCSLNTALLVRDRSICKLVDCTFEGNKDSLVSQDRSYVICTKCHFYQSSQTAITACKSSSVKVADCDFSQGRIFINEASKIQLFDSTLNKKGVIVANKSDCCLYNVKFVNIEGSAIRTSEQSNIFAKEVSVFGVKKGNGISFDNSTGYVSKSNFENIDFPAIAVNGPLSNPVISYTSVSNVESFAVACRNSSCANFEFCNFNNIAQNAFSISDSSYPIIDECTFEKIQGSAFSIYNGAKPLIKGNKIGECGRFSVDVFDHGIATLFNNQFDPSADKYNSHRKGEIIEENEDNFEYQLTVLREFSSELEPFNPPIVNGQKLKFYTPPDDKEVPKLDFFETPDFLADPIMVQQIQKYVPQVEEEIPTETNNGINCEMKTLLPCKHQVSTKCAEEISLQSKGFCPLCQSFVSGFK